MIRFNVPPFTGKEYEYIKQAVDNQKICGDGEFTAKCNKWMEEKTGSRKRSPTTTEMTSPARPANTEKRSPLCRAILNVAADV